MVSEAYLSPLLRLALNSKIAGPPERTMFEHIRQTYFWPLIVAHIASTVPSYQNRGRNCLPFMHRKKSLCVLPEKNPQVSISVYRFNLLSKMTVGKRFGSVMEWRFSPSKLKSSHGTEPRVTTLPKRFRCTVSSIPNPKENYCLITTCC